MVSGGQFFEDDIIKQVWHLFILCWWKKGVIEDEVSILRRRNGTWLFVCEPEGRLSVVS